MVESTSKSIPGSYDVETIYGDSSLFFILNSVIAARLNKMNSKRVTPIFSQPGREAETHM